MALDEAVEAKVSEIKSLEAISLIEAGLRGPQGERGPAGPRGERGPRGNPTTISVYTTVNDNPSPKPLKRSLSGNECFLLSVVLYSEASRGAGCTLISSSGSSDWQLQAQQAYCSAGCLLYVMDMEAPLSR